MILRFSKYATVNLPTSRSVIAAGSKAIGRQDWTGINLVPDNHQASIDEICIQHPAGVDKDMDIDEITQKVTKTGIGRSNAGMQE